MGRLGAGGSGGAIRLVRSERTGERATQAEQGVGTQPERARTELCSGVFPASRRGGPIRSTTRQ